MERDNKILISAVLLIGIAIFASNLNLGISGKATGGCVVPTATVTPEVIKAGESVEVAFEGYAKMPIDIVAKDGRSIHSETRGCFGEGNVCDNGGKFTIQTLSRQLSKTWQDDVYCAKARTCEKVNGLRDREIIEGSCFRVSGSTSSYRYG